ncbi:MAG: ACT domain-containing protein, partial [Gammaproteobacteria bacterium]
LGVTGLSYEKLAHQFKYQAVDELLAAIGRGDINATQLASAVNALAPRDKTSDDARPRRARKGATATADGISVRGVGNLLTTMARCCHPVPNDPVVGYITRGRGVTIHRQDCGNVLRLQGEDLDRLIEVEWGAESDAGYLTDIRVLAYDRAGLLRDITGVLANEKINLLGANTATDKEDGMARMNLTVEITDINQLSRALTLIGQLPNVVEARRKV